MANISITNLPAATSVSGTDSVPIVQTSTSVRATLSQIAAYTQSVYPAPGVTSIATSGPITGGTITSTGTISLSTGGVTNTYLDTMPTLTLKGNSTGGTASPSDLSTSTVMTMLGAAPLASPTFTGTPLAPTPSTGDSSTQIATTAFVTAQGYGTGSVTSVTAGSGLSGGTITTTGTISLPITGVTAASYGSSSAVPTFTVDTYGRITAASNTNISTSAIGAVPTSRTISTSGGISGGGDLTADRTFSLTPIANNTLLGNTSGSSASPSSTTLTALMDATLGSQQGSVIYRAGSIWTSLPPGTADQILATAGPSANPFWKSVTGTGTVTSVNATGGTTGLTFTGGPITTSGTLVMSGTLGVANGGTNLTASPTNGQLLIGNGTGYTLGTLTAGSGIGVSNSSGSITISNSGVTSAVAGTGISVSAATGAVTFTNSGVTSLTGGTGINVSGSTGGVTVNLSNTAVSAGAYGSSSSVATFTVNAQGQLTAAASTPINAIALTTGTISTAPTNSTDIVNKLYVDSTAQGLNFHAACNYATTSSNNYTVTYNNGSSGVGATLTNAGALAAFAVDGATLTSGNIGNRILIKNQTNTAYNGIYTLTTVGSGSVAWVLTRATDFNTAGTGPNQIDAGDFVLILSGTANANTSWVQQTPLPIVVGTTGITFTQFGAQTSYSAGTGLTLAGTTFSITDTTVTANSYGSASTVGTFTVNGQGQLTAASSTSIAIGAAAITSGTINTARISGSYTGITGVGTLTAGTWNGTAIASGYGGTGFSTYATGDIIYASATDTLSKLAAGTNGYILTLAAGVPTWAAAPASGVTTISFGTTGLTPSTASSGAVSVAGTLVAANGGTGQSSYTVGDLLYASGTTTLSKLPDVATGSVLVSGGVGVSPAYSTTPTVTSITAPTHLGGTAVSSTLTLQSTSGVGSSDSIVMRVGNNGATTGLSIATTGIVSFPTTGAIVLPVGTTAQQPTAATGMIRFNSTNVTFEGYNGTIWGSIGGGATGGSTDQIFYLNGQTVTANYSIPSSQNAGTFGPVTINSGATVTVPSGSTWSIV